MKKTKPIIFSTKMIEAILNTQIGVWPAAAIDPDKPFKSMTRRIVKPRYKKGEVGFEVAINEKTGAKGIVIIDEEGGHSRDGYYDPPYQIGDIIWVRETFAPVGSGGVIYKADPIFDGCNSGDIGWEWKPSIFMPKKAARLFLEVKSVRAERLQDINETDAELEGSYLSRCECIPTRNDKTPIEKAFQQNWCHIHGTEFKKLWNGINAKRGYSWESNPWVWVYEFMRIKK